MHKDRISEKPVLWIEFGAKNGVKQLKLRPFCSS